MLELDDAGDSERVADWIELELSLGEPSFSKSTVTSVIRDATGIEPGESFASDVWQYLRTRIALYSTPFFEIDADLARRRDDVTNGRLEYETCLFFSLYGAPQGSNPKLFERMSAEAIGHHINGPVYVFGWPVLADVEAAIAARVKEVSDLLRERFAEAPRASYKDRGVDIISWKPFAEPDYDNRRSGQLVVLSQCAAGHDWRKKTRELPIASWIQYIHWATDPIAAFAVACVIRDDLWHDVAREVEGLVFDRVRLVNYLPQGVQNAELRGALDQWRTEQIEEHRL
jgi:hypothetical protein